MESTPCGHLDRPPASRRHLHLRGLLEDISAEQQSVAFFHSEILHILEPLELRDASGSLQDAAALGSTIRCPYAAFHGDHSRAAAFDRVAPAYLGFAAHRDYAWVLRRCFARLSPAHEHQLRLLCDSRTDRTQEGFGRRGALRTRSAHDGLRL